MLVLFLIILAGVVWFRMKYVSPEKNARDARQVRDAALYATIGAAAGLAKAIKDDDGGYK